MAVPNRSCLSPVINDKENCPPETRPIILSSRCVCFWNDCRQLQQAFTDQLNQGDSELRGGQCIALNLTGDSDKDIKYRDAVISNLGCSVSNLKLRRVPVARHHWSLRSLEQFTLEKCRPSTPVPFRVINETQFCFDRQDYITVKGKKMYFHLPNVPHDELSWILNPGSSIRVSQNQKRESARTEALRHQMETSKKVLEERAKKKQHNHDRQEAEKAEKKRIELSQTRKSNLASTIEQHEKTIDSLQHTIAQMKVDQQEREDDLLAELKEEKERRVEVERCLKNCRQNILRRDKKRKREESSTPSSQKFPKYEENEVLSMIEDFLAGYDGPSRMSLTDPNWYALRPAAASTLFGFRSYNELKEYVLAFFQNVPYHLPKLVVKDGKVAIDPRAPTDFEQILLVKYFLHTCPNRSKAGLAYNVHRTTMTKYLHKWAPLWAKYGEHLSILPMPHDYFEREIPDEILQLGLTKCGFLFDGKDVMTETVRKDDPIRRRLRSEKMHATAARWLNFMTPSGLSFEHTRLYGGRVTEICLTESHGCHHQHGAEMKAPVHLWKNYAQSNPQRQQLRYWTALDDIDIKLEWFDELVSNPEPEDETTRLQSTED